MHSRSFHSKYDTPRALPELETEWLQLFASMRLNPGAYKIEAKNLAAPFLSTANDGYRPGTPGSIMVVGKATSGKNTLGRAEVADEYDADTVKRRISEVIQESHEGKEHSVFMRFTRELSVAVAEGVGQIQQQPYENLIWTNLAKIGVISGNPTGPYLQAQMELAVETLASEIAHYKPSIVVTTVHSFGYGPLRRAISELWESGPHDSVGSWPSYWRHPAQGGRPAILWTMHPERKKHAVLEAWKEVAIELASPSVPKVG